MVAWCTSRSMSAAATIASPRISPQASKPRLLVIDDAAALVAARDQREEQVGGLALEREVADLVDDQQLVALQASELLVEGVALLGFFEAADPLLGGGERDAVAVLAGLDPERDREVALAGAGRADQADVGVLLDPCELREVHHQRSLGGRLGGEVEVLQGLVCREAGGAGAGPGAGGFAGEHLGLAQRLEELLVGPLLLACALGGRGQSLSDPRCLQRREQVGQPLADLAALAGVMRTARRSQSALAPRSPTT